MFDNFNARTRAYGDKVKGEQAAYDSLSRARIATQDITLQRLIALRILGGLVALRDLRPTTAATARALIARHGES